MVEVVVKVHGVPFRVRVPTSDPVEAKAVAASAAVCAELKYTYFHGVPVGQADANLARLLLEECLAGRGRVLEKPARAQG